MRLNEKPRRSGRDRIQLAEAFIAFTDGLDQAGLGKYARRGRDLAWELIRAEKELQDERSCRVSFQKTAQRWEAAFVALGTKLDRMRSANRH